LKEAQLIFDTDDSEMLDLVQRPPIFHFRRSGIMSPKLQMVRPIRIHFGRELKVKMTGMLIGQIIVAQFVISAG
jgi:hypothetical protein